MNLVEVNRLSDFTVRDLVKMHDKVQVDPPYQRNGAIWSPERKRLLIDSILQGYDIPKLYFRVFAQMEPIKGKFYRYAIIDGRQRVETILEYVNNKFTLGTETEVEIKGRRVNLSGKLFSDLFDEYPSLSKSINDFPLDVVTVETDDLDVIEDMFLRLNEATPLNAAEKRNAFPGPIPAAAREISDHGFFTTCLPYGNSRYRHYDMATKFMYFELREGVADTKKPYLDQFVRTATAPKMDVKVIKQKVARTLDKLENVFSQEDSLLRSVGMSSVYYLVFQRSVKDGWIGEITREKLVEFEAARSRNRTVARESDSAGDYNLNEFDRFSQSPNDAIALRFRRDVVANFLGYPIEQMGEDTPRP